MKTSRGATVDSPAFGGLDFELPGLVGFIRSALGSMSPLLSAGRESKSTGFAPFPLRVWAKHHSIQSLFAFLDRYFQGQLISPLDWMVG